MEDLVTVVGTRMTDVSRMWTFGLDPMDIHQVMSHMTYVTVPGTKRYILNIERPGYPELNACCTWSLEMSLLYDPKEPLAPMDLPRPVVLGYISACIQCLQKSVQVNPHCKESLVREIRALETWKATLILEGLRRRLAARAIQRQFREAIANPAYTLCQKRLLQEFRDFISGC